MQGKKSPDIYDTILMAIVPLSGLLSRSNLIFACSIYLLSRLSLVWHCHTTIMRLSS
jgi:hypothetical protein